MPTGVHDSALIVNAFRAKYPRVSSDRFAALWITEESEKWANAYAEKVGPTEVLVHALRHRFFLDELNRFLEIFPDGVFINIGAGFTNYPYLIASITPCCEIDTELNLIFKKKKLAEFNLNGAIPDRMIKFITVDDLNNFNEITALSLVLKEWVDGHPSFVLFEGVFFYLKPETISFLYSILASLQKKGDIVAATSFRPEECSKEMFKRLVEYCRRDYRMMNFMPTTVPTIFYAQQSGYLLASHENYYGLSMKYGFHDKLDKPEEVLEEDCYILERL